jgi:hypothetical protein
MFDFAQLASTIGYVSEGNHILPNVLAHTPPMPARLEW